MLASATVSTVLLVHVSDAQVVTIYPLVHVLHVPAHARTAQAAPNAPAAKPATSYHQTPVFHVQAHVRAAPATLSATAASRDII